MSQNFSNPNIKSKSLKEVPIIKNVGDDIVDDWMFHKCWLKYKNYINLI